jgi:hypothetical protein
MSPNCEVRNSSTVAPQSLLLMNNEFIIEQSEKFAERVMSDAGTDRAKQIDRAWRLVFGVAPTAAERARAEAFLTEQKARFAALPRGEAKTRFAAFPAGQALASFCQMLISTNAFLYVD